MNFLQTGGAQDLQTVATFAQSAQTLGLVQEGSEKLNRFFQATNTVKTLSGGKLDELALTAALSELRSDGVLPRVMEQPQAVLGLIRSGRVLGADSAAKGTAVIAETLEKACRFGLLSPKRAAMASAAEEQPESGSAITWHRLYFAPVTFQTILSLDIRQAFNEHAQLVIEGVLPEGDERDYVQQIQADTPVLLQYVTDDKTVLTMFQGIVTKVSQYSVGGANRLVAEAASFSRLLDVERFSRSFQRDQESYRYVFERINQRVKSYVPNMKGEAVFVQESEAAAPTGSWIVQCLETDWEFLRRMASHFNVGLVPDVTRNDPKIYVGVPADLAQNGADAELNATQYKVSRDTAAYSVATQNCRKNSGATWSENDFTYCEAESLAILRLGQAVSFLEKTFYVRDMHTQMYDGIVKTRYGLTTRPGLMQDDRWNEQLAGRSLHGIVKEVIKDTVRVHIQEIDSEWDGGGSWRFSYTTPYSSPDGSGWYCMPEIGDNIRIYFPNDKEQHAVAVSSVNLTPSKRGARTDPNTKILSTVHGKQVILVPGGIRVIANDGLYMTLMDEGGVMIKSDKKIVLDAKDEIRIVSQADKIGVSSPVIELNQGGSTINMADVISVSGNQVKLQP